MRNILFILIVTAHFTLTAQAGLTLRYQTPQGIINNYQVQHITSDYGRREFGGHKFHNGIDFGVIGETNSIVPVVFGTISHLNLWHPDVAGASDFNNIMIDGPGRQDFGYGHMLRHRQVQSNNGSYKIANINNPGPNGFVGRVLLIDPSGNGDVYALTDIVDVESSTRSFTYDFDGDLVDEVYTAGVNLFNTVNAARPSIGSIGDAGSEGSIHVHLYLYDNIMLNSNGHDNTRDPIRFLDPLVYPRSTINREQISIEMKQSGNFFNNPSFRVQVEWNGINAYANLRYSNAVLAINDVSLRIRRQNETSSDLRTIKGAFFESLLSDGSRNWSDQRYPSSNFRGFQNPEGNTDFDIDGIKNTPTTRAGFGSYLNNGVVGLSYAGPGELQDYIAQSYNNVLPERSARDDYFFNDFPLAIKKQENEDSDQNLIEYRRSQSDMADSKDFFYQRDLRFPDDKYLLLAKIGFSDLAEPSINSNPLELIVDNIAPFIQKVEIQKRNTLSGKGIMLYNGWWEWNDLSGSPVFKSVKNGEITSGDELRIIVVASEPLMSCSIRMEDETLFTDYDEPNFEFGENAYNFNYPALNSTQLLNKVKLVIKGRDFNNNELQTDPSQVSIRINDGTGVNAFNPPRVPGLDMNHDFLGDGVVDACNPGGRMEQPYPISSFLSSTGSCILVDFDASKRNPVEYESVVFRATGSADENLDYSWNFGTDAIPQTSTKREVTVLYKSSGLKTVELSICDGASCLSEIKNGFLNVGGTLEPLAVNFTASRLSAKVDDEIQLVPTVTGAQDLVTYTWDFGEDAHSYDNWNEFANVSYSSTGSKNVSLTVSDGYRAVTKTKNGYIYIHSYPFPITPIASVTPPGQEGYVQFTGGYSGGDDISGNETYFWEFGDGGFSTQKSPSYNFLSPGTYFANLTVCDNSGCNKLIIPLEIYVDIDLFTPQGFLQMSVNNVPSCTVPINQNMGTVQSCSNNVIIYVANNSDLTLTDISKALVGDLNNGGMTFYIIEPSLIDIDYDLSKQAYYVLSEEIRSVKHHFELLDTEVSHEYYIDFRYYYNYVGSGYYVGATTIARARIIVGAYGSSGTCVGTVTDISPSQGCYNEDGSITFSLDVESNCEIGYVSIYDDQGNFVTSSDFDYELNVRQGMFPYKANLFAYTKHDCDIPNVTCDDIPLASHSFPIELDGPRVFTEFVNYYQLCQGATSRIGYDLGPEFSYNWDSSDPNALDYLSSKNSATPIFSAVESIGSPFVYTLEVISNVSGCSTFKDITVDVSSILSVPYSTTVTAERKIVLSAPVSGDGSGYSYRWEPSDFLDDPYIPNPILTAPSVAQTLHYDVTVSFRDECVTSSSVDINVLNFPPSDLIVTSGEDLLTLQWRDNGAERDFEIWRSIDGGDYTMIDVVYANTTMYEDRNCINPNFEYCYLIKAHDIADNFIGNSNTSCGVPDRVYKDWWSQDEPNVRVQLTHNGVPNRIGEFFDLDEEYMAFIGVRDNGSGGYYSENYTAYLLNKITGEIERSEAIDSDYGQYDKFHDAVSTPDKIYVVGRETNLNSGIINEFDKNSKQWNRWPLFLAGGNKNTHNLLFDEINNRLYHGTWGQIGSTYGALVQVIDINTKQVVFERIVDADGEFVDFEFDENGIAILTKNISTGIYEIFNIDLHLEGNVNLILDGENYRGFFKHNSELYLHEESNSLVSIHKITLLNYSITRDNIYSFNLDSEITYSDFQSKSADKVVYLKGTSDINNSSNSILEMRIIDLNSGIENWTGLFSIENALNIFEVSYDMERDNIYVAGIHKDYAVSLSPDLHFDKYSVQDLPNNPYLDICQNDILPNVVFEGGVITIAENCIVNIIDEDIAVSALNSIILYPGTSISSGSTFTAYINTSSDCEIYGVPNITVSESSIYSKGNKSIEHNLIIYPNPTTGVLTVNLTSNTSADEKFSVSIISISGTEIMQKSEEGNIHTSFDFSNFPSGLYFLKIESSGGYSESRKILVSH